MAAAAMATELYSPLANLMGLGKIKDELEDAAFEVRIPEERAELRELLAGSAGEARLLAAADELQAALAAAGVACVRSGTDLSWTLPVGEGLPYAEMRESRFKGLVSLKVSSRAKSAYSTWRKMQKKRLRFEQVLDRAAMRFLLDAETAEDADRLCYAVRDAVVGLWPSDSDREKDYVARPKENGYRSLHLVVRREGQPFEVQIRTQEMHRQAEYGACGHWEYKAGEAVKPTAAAQRAGAELFASVDTDGSGGIDAEELREVLQRVGVEVTEDEAQAMLEVFDADSDGVVGFKDFWEALVTTWFPLVSGTHKPRRRQQA